MIKKITLPLLFLLSCLSFASDIKNDEILTLFENELSNPNIEQQLPDYIEMVKDLKQKYENSIIEYDQFINEIYVAEVQKAEMAIDAVNRGNLSKREKRLFATNVRKNAMNKVKPLYQQQIKKFFRIVGLLPSNGCDSKWKAPNGGYIHAVDIFGKQIGTQKDNLRYWWYSYHGYEIVMEKTYEIFIAKHLHKCESSSCTSLYIDLIKKYLNLIDRKYNKTWGVSGYQISKVAKSGWSGSEVNGWRSFGGSHPFKYRLKNAKDHLDSISKLLQKRLPALR